MPTSYQFRVHAAHDAFIQSSKALFTAVPALFWRVYKTCIACYRWASPN